VQLEYWKAAEPAVKWSTEQQTSKAASAHAMDVVLGGLEPGTTYAYRIIGSAEPTDPGPFHFTTQPLWKYRTDPPPFTVALGSCAYVNEPAYDRPGKAYGGDYGIFDAIADKDPDLMLWLGDNIYLREPDWGSRSGYLHRYTHVRSTPQLQRLLHSTKHYAIWDDHDFGPNDPNGSWVHSPIARETFDLFWPNPTNGVPGVEGVTTAFSHVDVDFFLMDDRTFRTPADLSTAPTSLLGDAQIDWLIQALKYSDAPFKLVAVGSQVLNTAAVFENYANFPAERNELLRRIEAEGIRGVVFVTGDRHHTSLSTLALPDGRRIHDLTVSPLTAGVHGPVEKNELLVEGTVVAQHNFATASFDGAKGSRTMVIRVFDADGGLLWERSIPQE
jgi:alkaline phosphatase D